MAFGNVAGTAGFVLTLDKSQLDSGLPEAERQFQQSVGRMSSSAQQMTSTGLYSPQQVNLAEKYGLTDLINQNDVLDEKLRQTNAQIGELEVKSSAAAKSTETLGGGLARTAGGMAATLAKGSLYAAAITTAYYAHQHLIEALKTEGEEAFTTEGRLRNMGAALTNGDIFAAFDAWERQPKTLEEAGISAREASAHLEALKNVMNGNVQVLREQALALQDSGASSEEVTAAWDKYQDAVDKAGTGNRDLAASAVEVGRAYRETARDVQTMTASVMGLRDAQGQLIVGFTPGQQFAVAAGTSSYGVPTAPPGSILGPGAVPFNPPPPRSLPQRLEDQMAEAQRNDNISEQIRIQREVVAFTKRRLAIVNPENRKLWEERNDAYQRAQSNLSSLEDQADREAQAAADKAESERQRRRAEAETRATEAARRYREGLETHEQTLRNAWAAALLTPRKSDDVTTFRALKQFLIGEGRDPRLEAGERVDYRAEVVALDTQRKQSVEQADQAADKAAQEAQKTREQRLKNAVARAELTKNNVRDDLKALRDLRDFYKRAAKDKKDIYTALEQAQFDYEATQTQKKINDLLGKAPEDEGRTAKTLFDATNRILRDFSSNVMNGGPVATGSAPATVVVHQHFKAPTPDRMREARMARFAAEAQFVG